MKYALFILIIFITFTNFVFAYPKIPDSKISPGHLCSTQDKDFKEFRYFENIPYCSRNVSSNLKQKIYEIYKIPKNDRNNYTIDHIIPLSLGGSNNFKNLWPEHYEVKNRRKDLEYELFVYLRDGKINHANAIKTIILEKFKEVD